MIVRCPSCAARIRLNRDKLAGKRVTLRCVRCRSPFKVDLPHVRNRHDSDTAISVIVAHSDRELCATINQLVEQAGMVCAVGHEGAEVLAMMDADPPQVAVVDVALQGLYAFEVVEKVRQRPGLENVKIILLSSVYNKTAYKRAPNSLYGADDYIEKHHIPDDLVPKINRLLTNAGPAVGSEPRDSRVADGEMLRSEEAAEQSFDIVNAINEKIRSAENHEYSAEELTEIEGARRLARIIVSDIALYYQEKIDEGIRKGNWTELLANEVKEARRLFRERFPSPQVQQSRILEAAFVDLLDKRRRELEL